MTKEWNQTQLNEKHWDFLLSCQLTGLLPTPTCSLALIPLQVGNSLFVWVSCVSCTTYLSDPYPEHTSLAKGWFLSNDNLLSFLCEWIAVVFAFKRTSPQNHHGADQRNETSEKCHDTKSLNTTASTPMSLVNCEILYFLQQPLKYFLNGRKMYFKYLWTHPPRPNILQVDPKWSDLILL